MTREEKRRLFTGLDQMSEESIQNRLDFLRDAAGGGDVHVPNSWVEEDPAMRQAVEELDWLHIEEPQ